MALSISPAKIVESGQYPLLVKHKTWERIPLGEVAIVQNGFPFESRYFDRERGVPLIRIRDVMNEETEHRYTEKFDPAYLVHRGDILIGMDGDFRAARWKGNKGLLNQRVCRIKLTSDYFDEDFLVLCLQPYLDAINSETSSVTVKHLSSRSVAQIPLPLPPLEEQRRIVAKVEELFSELDQGAEALITGRDQLKAYRQSLLKRAFEGKLTQRCRAQYPGEMQKPPARLAIPDDLAVHCTEQWAWLRLGDVSSVTGGLTKNGKRSHLPISMKYLRVANVYADRLELDDIAEMPVTAAEFENVRLQTGDMLVVEGNGSVEQIGRVALWDGKIPDVGHQNHLIRVRLGPGMSPRFFLLFLISPLGRDLVVRQASSTSGLHTLSISKVSGLPVPVPTAEEQAALVAVLDAAMSGLEKLGQEVEAGLARCSSLRHSVLEQAFSGQLIPQERKEEPASALLERIRGERQLASTTMKRAAKIRRKKAA